MHDEALLPRKWLEICLVMEGETKFPGFALIPCVAFAFFIKLPLSQPMSLAILLSYSVEES